MSHNCRCGELPDLTWIKQLIIVQIANIVVVDIAIW